MNGNNLSSQSGTYLSELLSVNNSIGSLYLANNNITSPGIIKLFTAIKTNTALNTFDISYNNLQGSDLEEVSTILGKDSNICSLNLAGNTMTLHSATEIGAVIGSSTQLKSINFANMNINEEMICNLLISKRLIMEEIIFDGNPLGDIALMSIANALTQNVKKVSIRKFNVISTCYAMLLNKINMFKGIEEIHLEDNAISEELFNLTIAFIAKNQIKTKLYFTQNMLAMDHNAIAAFGKVSNIIFE
jgi:Ran GTPase-activating protein (RanGAP) involved in mRNA processing and transport